MLKRHHSDGGVSVAALLHSHRGRRRTLFVVLLVLLVSAVSTLPAAKATFSMALQPDPQNNAPQEYAPQVNQPNPAWELTGFPQQSAQDRGISLEGPLVIDANAPGAHSVMTADFDHDGPSLAWARGIMPDSRNSATIGILWV